MRKKEYDSLINGKLVPFSAHGDASDENLNKGRRVEIVKDFIGGIPVGRTLDIGPPNAFGQALEIKDNTTGDLNDGVVAPSKDYDLILFSEILEHLMNPLQAMRDCYRLLRPGGLCIVCTPKASWHTGFFYQSPHHFTEYKPDRLRKMFEYAGFSVVKYKTINIWDKRFALYGFRPLLRVLFHRSQLWMLRK